MIRFTVKGISIGSVIHVVLENKRTAFRIDKENDGLATVLEFKNEKLPVFGYSLFFGNYTKDTLILNFDDYEEGGLFMLKVRASSSVTFEKMFVVPERNTTLEFKKIKAEASVAGKPGV